MQPARNNNAEPEGLPSLLAKGVEGDVEAQTELVERFHGLVTGVVSRFFSDPAEREDVVQESWYRVLRNLHAIEKPASFPAFVGQTARNTSLDRLRRTRRFEPLDPDAHPVDSQGDRVVLSHQLVERALQHLSPAHFAVLALKLYGGMTFNEIAESLDVPIGTVSTRYYTAIEKLQRAVGLT